MAPCWSFVDLLIGFGLAWVAAVLLVLAMLCWGGTLPWPPDSWHDEEGEW